MAQNQSATTFQELSGLLRGQGEGGGARAEGSGGSPQQGNGAKAQQQRAQPGSALTKLADLASTSGPVGAAAAAMAAQFPAQFPAQEQPNLVVAPLQAPLPFPLPAQPGLAGAALSDGQQAGQQAATGEDGRPQQPTAAQVAAQAQAAAAMLAPFGDFAALAHPPMMLMGGDFANMGVFQMQPGEEHLQHMPREKSSKPTRRGPMDEMRQLVRILIKILPQSVGFIGTGDEPGGGNRISEEQIKVYLEKTLGQAPRPTWGVPNGWYNYLSTLFTWASGRQITDDDAKRCAKREPGRSWEAIDSEMALLGVHPNSWPLPLTQEGVQAAEKNPVPQPVPQIIIKRSTDDAGQPVSKRARASTGGSDLERMGEAELWMHVLQVLEECQKKQGKGADQATVASHKLDARTRMDALMGSMNMFQYVPVMGLDGGQSVMALLGGMPFGLPQGGDVSGVQDPEQVNAALQAAMATISQSAAGTESARKRAREEGEGGEGADAQAASDAAALAKHAPLSSQDARGSLFGALGGMGGEDAAKQALGGALPLQAPPLLYAQPGGLPNFMMPNALAAMGVMGAGQPEGAAPAAPPQPAPTE